jgi:hypothetical protein
MSNNKSKTKSNPIIKKVVKNTANVGDKIPVELVKDNRIQGGYLRGFLGSTTGVTREYILHHPIGVTHLEDDEWVISDPSDVPILLSRTKDPYGQKLADGKAKFLTDKAVEAKYLKLIEGGDLVYTKGKPTTRKAFFTELETEFQAREKPAGSNVKFDVQAALGTSTDDRARVETHIRKLFADMRGEADARFASNFVTCGGPRGDRPQVPLGWAKGLTPANLSDMLLKHGTEGPPRTVEPTESVGVAASVQMDFGGSVNTSSAGQPGQWCYLPRGLSKKVKKEVKLQLQQVKLLLEKETGEEYFFEVSHATS